MHKIDPYTQVVSELSSTIEKQQNFIKNTELLRQWYFLTNHRLNRLISFVYVFVAFLITLTLYITGKMEGFTKVNVHNLCVIYLVIMSIQFIYVSICFIKHNNKFVEQMKKQEKEEEEDLNEKTI